MKGRGDDPALFVGAYHHRPRTVSNQVTCCCITAETSAFLCLPIASSEGNDNARFDWNGLRKGLLEFRRRDQTGRRQFCRPLLSLARVTLRAADLQGGRRAE